MQNTSNSKLNTFEKGLVQDFHENMIPANVWTHARNLVINSHIGQVNFVQNEPSTKKCLQLELTPIGFIKLLNKKWTVFSTNNIDSEIGIFDEANCSYKKLVNDKCLNFSTSNLIKGAARQMFDCSESIYWSDGNRNPRRHLNLSSIPYQFTEQDDTCKTREYSTNLDCSALLIDRQIKVPKISATAGAGGNLKNGVYEFGIAYTVNKERVTDYYGISAPERIWNHSNTGASVNVSIAGLDNSFDQYELLMIYTQNQVTRYLSIGFFNISTSQHHISSSDRADYTPLTLEEVLVARPKYPYADNVEANDMYLLWSGVTTTPRINYQKQAMGITTKYVVYQVPSNYYARGGNIVGYLRDEVYSFAVQWLRSNGEWTDAFHIPGRKSAGKDTILASGKDVFELLASNQACNPTDSIQAWQVSNTAGKTTAVLGNNSSCDERVIAIGDMAYWQSSEQYPSNTVLFGDDACTPIRHHKMPSECESPRYKIGGDHINILGVQFDNIEHPKNADGTYNTDIVGYRIVRGSREGNETVVARGVFTNVRSYTGTQGKVLYPNYPYNDLRADSYISSTQTHHSGSERDFEALTAYEKDKFNFYSPDTLIGHPSLGGEVNFYTEESSKVSGYFEKVYKHPRQKLLTQFDLYFALVIGAMDGFLSTVKKKCVYKLDYPEVTTIATVTVGTSPGTTTGTNTVSKREMSQICDSITNGFNGTTPGDIRNKFVLGALKLLAGAGMFAYFALQSAQDVIETIQNASGWQDYGLQYNSHGQFTAFKCVQKDNRRRQLSYYQYLYDGINSAESATFNNYRREPSVYIRTNDTVANPTVIDNSRQTITEFDTCGNIGAKTSSNASLFYGGIKKSVPDQYGQLDGITYQDTSYSKNVQDSITDDAGERKYTSDPVFGGDTFITRMTVKRSHNFFTDFLHDVPDGFIFDYRLSKNIGYPRFWMDSTPYDFSELISLNPSHGITPANKHNLDCSGNSGFGGLTVVKDRYFYLFNSGVIDFFVESKYNLDFRDFKQEPQNFYSQSNSNLTQLFRSDYITQPEEFIYDLSLSKQLTENAIFQQQLDYNPEIETTCYQYLPNRVIYSQPAFKDQKGDSWLVYLSSNFYDFPLTEFGRLTNIAAIDNQQIMFLFDKTSPYTTIGRDELQLDGSGKTVVLGDGGLFARPPRPVAYTDYHYGNCQSRFAFNNTQFGSFYPSQRQGRLFTWRGEMEELTQNGMNWWFKNHMPSALLTQFPDYINYDNPVTGVGMTSVFDNTNETYYLTKKDYKIKDIYAKDVTYNAKIDKFLYKGLQQFKIGDPYYFDNASWTISYNPRIHAFVSWHDWKPDWLLQSENHFMSVKDNAIWLHNQRCDSFCNFYGVDYPFEIELVINNGPNVEILKSIEYYLETGKYYYDCSSYQTILGDNFDFAVVSNNQQSSGLLKMLPQDSKNMSLLTNYPYYDPVNQWNVVTYGKAEQKTRLNQFSDIISDLGKDATRVIPIWNIASDGYTKTLNDTSLNYNKPAQLRKKFRGTFNRIWLQKKISGDRKYILKFNIAKQTQSFI